MTNTATQPEPYPCNIKLFLHCMKCLEECPETMSPREWARNETGWTQEGIQVWCTRHEMNVIALDFMGQKLGRLA